MKQWEPYRAISIPAAIHRRPVDTISKRMTFRAAVAIMKPTDSTMLVEGNDLRCAIGNLRQVNFNISDMTFRTELAVLGQMPFYFVVRHSKNR